MKAELFEKSVDRLATIVEEGARADRKTTVRFVEPAQGTLRRAQSKRHHLVFGRRGSGKSSLLYKSAEELTNNGHPIAYVDLEPFKGLQYPDIIISVLLASISKFRLWLKINIEEDEHDRLWYFLWLVRKKDKKVYQKQELLERLRNTEKELLKELHLQDDVGLREKVLSSVENTESIKGKVSAKTKMLAAEGRVESEIGNALKNARTVEREEEFRRSKIDYLRRKILDFRTIFTKFNELTSADCFLFLDDLYHIRRSDQPSLLDYFHAVAKGNALWLKIGTIRNRSTWYINAPQPTGLKLGDDADEINLDLTLEKFLLSKDFLKSILQIYVSESKAPRLAKLVSDGGFDRLVLSSGGVARDFLGILRRSIDEAKERLTKNPRHHRGNKIGAEDVNVASGAYGDIKKEDFNRDTLDDKDKLEKAFRKIRIFCLDKIKQNIFLVDQDLKSSDNELLQELIDLRLIHHVKSRETVRTKPGKMYRALLLDVSQYTGERSRKDVELVEFWKGDKDILRKASFIYDPSIDEHVLINEVAEAAKTSKPRITEADNDKQEKLDL